MHSADMVGNCRLVLSLNLGTTNPHFLSQFHTFQSAQSVSVQSGIARWAHGALTGRRSAPVYKRYLHWIGMVLISDSDMFGSLSMIVSFEISRKPRPRIRIFMWTPWTQRTPSISSEPVDWLDVSRFWFSRRRRTKEEESYTHFSNLT